MAKTTIPFLPIVKKFVQEKLPNHILDHEIMGSGPIAYFELQEKKDSSDIKKIILIQKFMGSQSFRIELLLNFDGKIKGSKTFSYQLVRTHISLPKNKNITTFDYKDADNLKKILDVLSSEILKKEKIFFSTQLQYKPLINMLGNLMKYYSDWFKTESYYKYPTELLDKMDKDFKKKNKEILEDAGPEEKHSLDRLTKFTVYLIDKKYIQNLKSTDFDLHLWHFWHFGKPDTKNELEKELKESGYVECSICKDLKSKGDFFTKIDSIFGEYYEFVCKSCLSKA